MAYISHFVYFSKYCFAILSKKDIKTFAIAIIFARL